MQFTVADECEVEKSALQGAEKVSGAIKEQMLLAMYNHEKHSNVRLMKYYDNYVTSLKIHIGMIHHGL